ncbi:hypothetical protein [Tsuneonella amylolytica]|uniref:hypothetical protein n=1 Tax=Tsuneonella amylolytica TaxID=2338327 RepID=UPI000EA9D282|nr:hypothetical protein [Tsuneonella amylolytica]
MIGAFFRRIWETLRDGVRLWWLAPLIPLISAVPEFAQHVAEVNLGMFASKEAFRELANDPARWSYGYFKIAGLVLAMFAAARFWAVGKRWWDPRTIAWRPFLIGLALNVLVTVALLPLEGTFDGVAFQIVTVVLTVATLPLFVLMFGGLFGDREATLARAYRSGWSRAIMIGILFFGVMLGLQPLHQFNHTLAIGESAVIVWGLMIWDSILVGTMAALAGTAFHHGYEPLRRDAGDPASAAA